VVDSEIQPAIAVSDFPEVRQAREELDRLGAQHAQTVANLQQAQAVYNTLLGQAQGVDSAAIRARAELVAAKAEIEQNRHELQLARAAYAAKEAEFGALTLQNAAQYEEGTRLQQQVGAQEYQLRVARQEAQKALQAQMQMQFEMQRNTQNLEARLANEAESHGRLATDWGAQNTRIQELTEALEAAQVRAQNAEIQLAGLQQNVTAASWKYEPTPYHNVKTPLMSPAASSFASPQPSSTGPSPVPSPRPLTGSSGAREEAVRAANLGLPIPPSEIPDDEMDEYGLPMVHQLYKDVYTDKHGKRWVLRVQYDHKGDGEAYLAYCPAPAAPDIVSLSTTNDVASTRQHPTANFVQSIDESDASANSSMSDSSLDVEKEKDRTWLRNMMPAPLRDTFNSLENRLFKAEQLLAHTSNSRDHQAAFDLASEAYEAAQREVAANHPMNAAEQGLAQALMDYYERRSKALVALRARLR
jgi:hypothetical protein